MASVFHIICIILMANSNGSIVDVQIHAKQFDSEFACTTYLNSPPGQMAQMVLRAQIDQEDKYEYKFKCTDEYSQGESL